MSDVITKLKKLKSMIDGGGGKGWVDDPSDGGTMTCPECDNEPCHLCQVEEKS